MSCKLLLPIFCVWLLPCKPSSSFPDRGQKGAQRGLFSCTGIRWWALWGHVNSPAMRGRNSRMSLLPELQQHLCSPLSRERAPASLASLRAMWHSHLCPCFISSDCILLTFFRACFLWSYFWRAQEELGVSGLLCTPVSVIDRLELSNGCLVLPRQGLWKCQVPYHPPPLPCLLQHPSPGLGRDTCFKAMQCVLQPCNLTAIRKEFIVSGISKTLTGCQ